MSSGVAFPYTSETSCAPTLDALLGFLSEQDHGGYLYRGQTRLWPGPLFPSAFRRHRRNGAIYFHGSVECSESLRKVGKRFVGLVPINWFHESIELFYPEGLSPSYEEAVLLERLSNDQYLARTLCNGQRALEIMLTPLELFRFHDRLAYWKQVIDNDHRGQIRDMVFMWPFGYLLGQGLAQQYGFNSEMLDVTSNLEVAAFFATHDAPNFSAPVGEGIGVIYRFERPEPNSRPLDLGSYNFYSCPPILDFRELLERFLAPQLTVDRDFVEKFLVASFTQHKQWRRWEEFRVSSEILSATRVSRQYAALLVPDTIYVEREIQGARRNRLRVFTAMEDLASREGTNLFFFKRNADGIKSQQITREHLWPNEVDAFFEMIGNVLLASVSLDTGQILPSRIDLLDPGYRF